MAFVGQYEQGADGKKLRELTLYILQQEEKLQNYERRLQKIRNTKGQITYLTQK